MKRIGKQGQKWIRFRTEWFKNNPQDRYQCYICGDMLLPNETQLDHIASRARHPELRFIESNLAPVCHRCNRLKGSRDLEEVLGEIN
jgi:5-methylcytosine-specific restriction endonuclease McrA